MHVSAVVLVITALAVLGGCAAMPHQERSPLDRPGTPQTVAIVIEPDLAQGGTSAASMSTGTGALAGGAAGAQVGLFLLSLAGPQVVFMAPALGALVAGSALVGAAGGASIGAQTEALTDKVATLLAGTEATTARAALATRTAKAVEAEIAAITAVRGEVVSDAPASQSSVSGLPGPRGYGAVIALRTPALWFWARLGIETRMAMALAAEGRLVDPVSGRTTAMRTFFVESAPHTAAEWTREDGALAKREGERLVRALAERVVEAFVLQSGLAVGEYVQTCGVVPVEPRYEPPFTQWSAQRVDSPVPRLAWEARPREPASLAPPAGASDFRYDLRVWSVVDGRVDALVAERLGLRDPEYRFEAPLAPATTYGWSVRARYTVDGRARASRWSAIEREHLPWSNAQGVLAYGVQQGERVVAQACLPRNLTPCGCLDFLPAANLWQFVTP